MLFRSTLGTSDDAEIDFSEGLATTAVDDDLVYGGHTVTNSIMKQANGNTVYYEDGWPNDGDDNTDNDNTNTNPADDNPGLINPTDSAYIGAIGAVNGKNVDRNIEVAPVASMGNTYAVTIHMPQDFLDAADSVDNISTQTDRGDLYFAGLKITGDRKSVV